MVTLGHLARSTTNGPSADARRQGPTPGLSRDDITAALDAHLCPCGSQPRIIAAALSALGVEGG